MRQSKDSSDGSSKSGINEWFASNWRSLTVLLSIFLIALILRIFFAYGTSAGSGFALSGGSDAAYHLRVIEHIVETGRHIIIDDKLNYPFGGLNYNPPLFDWSVALLAFPLTLFGLSATDASSIALVYSTAIVGALTCIPVYLLGKEMFSRKAGYIAAAFFAISSIAIVKTVFSNGTESAYFVFFFVLTSLFMLRAIRSFKPDDGDASPINGLMMPFKDKALFKNLLFAGLSLLALQLSWIGFLTVITIMSIMMVVQAVIDRFRGKSAMPYVAMYASVMLFATLIASLYYFAVMGMTMVVAGPLCVIILATVISFIISAHRVWVITIPVSVIIFAAFMGITSLFVPSLFSAMTSGAHPYAQGVFGSLLASTQSVALSSQAVYAGMVTMWFSVIVAAYMIFRLPKNAGSPKYLFIVTWFLALLYASWQSADLAYLAAPMYAIGTGAVIVWILKHVDLKGYAENFKGSTIKTFWRKLLKPLPFVTVLATVLLLLMPNVIYAVDASIPNNQKGDYDSELSATLGGMGSGGISYLGATNFYIKDKDWTPSMAWSHFSSNPDPGSLVTWLDYGAEAVAYGNFSVVADSFGNGYSAASNILLGSPSESIAAMTVRLIQYNGAVPSNLLTIMTPVEFAELELIIFDNMSISDSGLMCNIDYVRTNPGIFGATSFDITEENAMYLAAAHFLASTFTDGDIAKIYDEVRSHTDRSLDYIGVTGNMLPLYYGDNNIFSTMAYLNNYFLDRNGSATKYYTAGIPYYGYYYTYKDAMYETMVWKALIGPSLYDYRAMTNSPNLSFAEMINGLMFSNGTLKAYPGYGLGNFSVADDEWWVTYNLDSENPSSDGWVLMLAKEAQAKQAAEGGLINYFGGMSFLKYGGDGIVYEGEVTSPAGKAISGLTVAVFDASGNLLGRTVTNSKGEYSLMISCGVPSEIRVYSGTVYAMEVMVVDPIPAASSTVNITVAWSEVTGTLAPPQGGVMVELNGRVSGESYAVETDASGVFSVDVVPDTYSVTMTSNGIQIYTGTFTLYPGEIHVGDINIKSVDVQITVVDNNGSPVEGAEIEILDSEGNPASEPVKPETDEKGVATAKVAAGSYTVQLFNYDYKGQTYILVPNTSNTITTTNTNSFTANLNSTSRLTVRMVEAAEVVISNVIEGDIITLTNGAYAPRGTYTTTVVATAADESAGSLSVYVPVGDYGNASTYTASIMTVTGATVTTVYAKVDYDKTLLTNTVDKATAAAGTVDVTMNMKFEGEAIGGVVAFIDTNNMIITTAIGDSGESVVKLPAGTYTVYAYARETVARDSKAYVSAAPLPIISDQTLDIELVPATFVSGTVRYSGPSLSTGTTSNIGVAFVPVIIKDGANTLITSTDALGNYSIVLPRKTYTNAANTEMLFGSFMWQISPLGTTISANVTTGTATANITVNPMTPNNTDIPLDETVLNITIDNVEITLTYSSSGVLETITLQNDNDNSVYVVMQSGDVQFTTTQSGATTVAGGLIQSLTTTTAGSNRVINVQYNGAWTGSETMELIIVNGTMTVDVTYPSDSLITISASGTDVEPEGPPTTISPTTLEATYLLTTRSYDLLLAPENENPGDTGYYYSGKMRIFAGQTEFDASSLAEEVVVVKFDVAAGDKISFTGGKAFESKSSTDTEKVYYVLMADWATCVLVVENDTQIAYINLANADADLAPVVVSEYMGTKASISGYVGIIANGTMEITMEMEPPSTYLVSIEVPIANGEYTAVLPTLMGGETIIYEFAPKVEFTTGDIEYTFELSPLINIDLVRFTSAAGRVADGKTINMEVTLSELEMPKPEIEISITSVTYSGGTAQIEFDVTNNTTSSATAVLTGGTGWSSVDFGGNRNYLLVQPGETITGVVFNGTYDPSRTGEGNANLSVIARDVTGTVLLTQRLMTDSPVSGTIDEPVKGPNRVSKNEYGYGITLTNETSELISVTISIPAADMAIYSANNWYASVVDVSNYVVDPTLTPNILPTGIDPLLVPVDVNEFLINGNSSATFYLRLIWTGAGSPTLENLAGLPLILDVDGIGFHLERENTDIDMTNMSTTGNNIFDSMNGVPNIVWALIALSVLVALLIAWLGIRRGVFSRKR